MKRIVVLPGGCNDGINWAVQAGFEYIITLNNDCLVDRNWLGNLIAGLKKAGADYASARIMYYPETDLICSDGDGLLPDGTGYIVNPLQQFQGPGEIRPIFSACGAGAIFSAKRALMLSSCTVTSFSMSCFLPIVKTSILARDSRPCHLKV